MSKPDLSISIQDYLKEIYKLQSSGQRPTTTAIARAMGVAPSSATSMLKKLAALGLAEHAPYRGVELSEAGLLIHEGQLTYEQYGLHAVVDLGEWWLLETGLPLPLGINVARRDLGEEALHELSEVLRESIGAGLESREEALSYALQYGRGLDPRLADRFVGMYVNRLTEDYGDEGREAVSELLQRGEQIGAFERPVRVDFVS